MYIRPSRDGDAAELAPLVAETDRREIWEAAGCIPGVELRHAQAMSAPCLSIRRKSDNGIVAMLGVVPILPDVGRIWMIASPELSRRSRLFLRHARPFLDRIQRCYPLLFNTVAEFQHTHIRWLRWMGFTFIRRWPRYGITETPFLEFVRLRGRKE